MDAVTVDAIEGSASRDAVGAAPTWVVAATEVLAIIGLGISVYLTIVHFEGTQLLACTNTGIINCAKVTTSAQSRFLGIPVVFLGLFQYVSMMALCSPWAWRSQRREVHLARLAFATVGMGFVLWLIAAELLIVNNICEWCSGVHLVTFVLFILVVQTVPKMVGWTGR
jgi:uncharacterized membrane protein